MNRVFGTENQHSIIAAPRCGSTSMAHYFMVDENPDYTQEERLLAARDVDSLGACLDAPDPIIVLRKPADRSKSGAVMSMKMIAGVMNIPDWKPLRLAGLLQGAQKSMMTSTQNLKAPDPTKESICRLIIEHHCGPWLVPHIGPYINPVEPWMKWELKDPSPQMINDGITRQYDLLSKLRYIRFEELDEYLPDTKHGFSVDYSTKIPDIHYNEIYGWDQTISSHDLYLEEELYAYIILHAKKISPADWLKLK